MHQYLQLLACLSTSLEKTHGPPALSFASWRLHQRQLGLKINPRVYALPSPGILGTTVAFSELHASFSIHLSKLLPSEASILSDFSKYQIITNTQYFKLDNSDIWALAQSRQFIEMAANDELLESVKTRLSINLHPSKLASVLEGVQEHLNGLLLQWVVLFASPAPAADVFAIVLLPSF